MIPMGIPDSDSSDAAIEIEARITSITSLNSDIVELALALERPLIYQAGQVSLFFVPYHHAQGNEQGSYSFAHGDAPDVVNTLRFHIRREAEGPFIKWLFEGKRTGEQIILEGPFGSFAQIRPLTPAESGRRPARELGLCVRPAPIINTFSRKVYRGEPFPCC